jgi:type IV pilus assembly protein PilC
MLLKMLIKNNSAFQYFFDGIKLKIWLFGPLMMKIKLARFANYFAMMYGSGITVLDSLSISEGMVDNMVLENAIQRAREKIADGTGISASFETTNIFPSMIVRMIKIGEDTGAMDTALLNVSYFYNREVKESIDKIEPVMMPVLTLILGAIMMWIMIAVLGPVYDAVGNVKL